MDGWRVVALFGAMAASTTCLARSMICSFLNVGRQKMVATTYLACALVCVQLVGPTCVHDSLLGVGVLVRPSVFDDVRNYEVRT
jgi:hypothetical protein